MPRRILFVMLLVLVALAGVAAQPVSLGQDDLVVPPGTPFPTRPPLPLQFDPPELVFPPNLSIAGVPLAGLTEGPARSALERQRLAPLRRPLLLRLDERSLYLDPAEVGLVVDLDAALEQALVYAYRWNLGRWSIQLSANGLLVGDPAPVDIPLQVELDVGALQSFLADLAQDYDRQARPLYLDVLTDTTAIQSLGVLSPTWSSHVPAVAFFSPQAGRRMDVDAILDPLALILRQWQREPVRLPTAVVEPPPAPLSLLQEALRQRIAAMPGVIGVHVRDMQSGQEIGVNERVIFSGASVVKIAIMLQAYRALESIPEGEFTRDLWAMMIYSDNEASNGILAYGGEGDLVANSLAMTYMLYDLGLRDTCMYSPYWGGSYRGPTCLDVQPAGMADLSERQPLRTDPDLYRMTTARDMGRLLAYIYEASQGTGLILRRFPEQITPEECQAMLELMTQNADRRRIVAGVPQDTPVAHKSGWISDMKADTGVVYSPGGDYVFSMFVWEKGWLSDWRGNSRIADLSWLVYSFFNPF